MKYNEITYKVIKDNQEIEKNVKFRLESGPSRTLEKETGKSIIEYVQDESMTMVLTMLRYMRVFEDKTITTNAIEELYDELIDSGWTYKRIIQDIIYETLVISGFLEESEWEEMKKEAEELKKILKEKQRAALQNI